MIRQVSKELLSLSQSSPEGIKIVTNEEDITDIQATIEGPGNILLEIINICGHKDQHSIIVPLKYVCLQCC